LDNIPTITGSFKDSCFLTISSVVWMAVAVRGIKCTLLGTMLCNSQRAICAALNSSPL